MLYFYIKQWCEQPKLWIFVLFLLKEQYKFSFLVKELSQFDYPVQNESNNFLMANFPMYFILKNGWKFNFWTLRQLYIWLYIMWRKFNFCTLRQLYIWLYKMWQICMDNLKKWDTNGSDKITQAGKFKLLWSRMNYIFLTLWNHNAKLTKFNECSLPLHIQLLTNSLLLTWSTKSAQRWASGLFSIDLVCLLVPSQNVLQHIQK